jgi:hypothetical protein
MAEAGEGMNAAKGENSIVFSIWQKKPFTAIKEAVDKKLSSRNIAPPT